MPINSYLNQTVVKKTTASYDVYGTPVPALSVSIPCRIQSSNKRLVSNGAGTAGVEFTADAEIWVKSTEPLTTDDIITWDSNDYKVAKMDIKKTLTGSTSHKKGYLVLNKQ